MCVTEMLAVYMNVVPPAKVVIIRLKFLSILDSKIVCTVPHYVMRTPFIYLFIYLNMDY